MCGGFGGRRSELQTYNVFSIATEPLISSPVRTRFDKACAAGMVRLSAGPGTVSIQLFTERQHMRKEQNMTERR